MFDPPGTASPPDTCAWPTAPTAAPARMRAVLFHRFGSPDVLQTGEVATPRPAPGQVLVRVGAVSVGRLLDLAARAGTHPYARFELPHILGAEHAGTVAALGAGVTGVHVGQHVAVFPVLSCGSCAECADGRAEACPRLRIMGTHLRGAYAEYTSVPVTNVHVVPDGMGPADAAGLALAGPVAVNQLRQAGMQPGDWVLVQGAASALGSLTAALAAHRGARVIATSRAQWKRDRLLALGVAAALDPTGENFVSDVLDLTDGRGVAVAIDDLGEPRIWSRTMDVLGTSGVAVSSGAFLGGRVEVDLARLYSRCQRIIGVRTGNPASAALLWEEVAGGFRPVVDRTYPIAKAADAHRYLEADENFGRVALTVGDAWPN